MKPTTKKSSSQAVTGDATRALLVAELQFNRLIALLDSWTYAAGGPSIWGGLEIRESADTLCRFLVVLRQEVGMIFDLHKFEMESREFMGKTSGRITRSNLGPFRAGLAQRLATMICKIKDTRSTQERRQLMEKLDKIASKLRAVAAYQKTIPNWPSGASAALSVPDAVETDALQDLTGTAFRVLDDDYQRVEVNGTVCRLARYAGRALRLLHSSKTGHTAEQVRRAAGCSRGTKTSVSKLFRYKDGPMVFMEVVEYRDGLYRFKSPSTKSED